jgi:tetratricopeptide (TPR) repeat protein
MNLKGAAYTKKKDFVQARACFEKSLELVPGMFAARFNLGEIEFLQGNYDKALSTFRSMLEADPRNELLQFKVFLCYLQMKDDEAAQKALAKVRYPGDTPAWYYAQAAWEFSRGNKGLVSDYLSGARYIFPGKTEIFDETFADLGFPRK